MDKTVRYSRRVSFTERLYIAAENLKPGFCIQIVIEGEGGISESALCRAVSTATAANPGARLVVQGGLGQSRWVAEGPEPTVRTATDWTDEKRPPESILQPLSPTTGPTVDVVLSSTPSGRIAFRCFHGVMDARGLLHFAEDVFRALRGETLVGSDFALNDTEFVESLVGPLKRGVMKGDRQTITGGRSLRSSEVVWRRVTLKRPVPALVARIIQSLTSIAAQYRVDQTRYMIPVDLRNYSADVRGTGNLTLPLFIDGNASRDWRAIQSDILKRLSTKDPLRLDPAEHVLPWLPIGLVEAFYSTITRSYRITGRFPFSALVTHLAIADLGALGCEGFRAESLYFLPAQMDAIPLCVSAVSRKNAAELIVSAPTGIVSPDELDRICASLSHIADM